eukprot:scaffold309771_cov24-Tisochrysis_lutea.AAC.1
MLRGQSMSALAACQCIKLLRLLLLLLLLLLMVMQFFKGACMWPMLYACWRHRALAGAVFSNHPPLRWGHAGVLIVMPTPIPLCKHIFPWPALGQEITG